MAQTSHQQIYEFGSFRIDATKRLLLRNGQVAPLTPKCFDILLALVENSGKVVEKDDLMRRVWPDSFVEESNLTYNVSMLRKALGERAGEHQYIATIPGRGYSFVSTLKEVRNGDDNVTLDSRVNPVLAVEVEGKPDERDEMMATKSSGHGSDDTKRPQVSPVLVLVTSLIALTGIGYGLYQLINQRKAISSPSPPPLVSRLSFSGNVRSAAISPDGKFLAQVIDDAGQESLLVKQVTTTSYQEIVPPARVNYLGLTFSHNGEYIYYVRTEEKNPGVGVLYKVPILGGTPIKLLAGVSSPIAFSPDGGRFAFVRLHQSEGESTLVLANANGTGEQKLLVRKVADSFSDGGPAWSPDGRTIAFAGSNGVVEVQVENGIERQITSQLESVGQLAWLSDGSGLIMTAKDHSSMWSQVWHLSYPAGVARKLTNDVNRYRSIGLTSDSSAAVTVQTDLKSSIWTQPYEDTSRARQITFSNYCGRGGISWAPDGKIVYRSIDVEGKGALWIMDPDGRNQRQLTLDSSANYGPSVTPDGRYVVFVSTRMGSENLWRIDIDGANPVQLTYASYAGYPHCSPDGKWVVYQSEDPGKLTIWKVTIDGGDPVQLTNYASGWPMFSPDGKLITCFYWDQQTNPQRWRTGVIPNDGGQPLKRFDSPPTAAFLAPVRWTADGRALTYVESKGGIGNIWS